MPFHMYVSLQIDNKIAHLEMDPNTGKVKKLNEIAAPGGPAPMTLSRDKTKFYVGYRGEGDVGHVGKDGSEKDEFGLEAYAIDQKTGDMKLIGKRVHTKGEPCYVSMDQRGRFLAASFFQVGHAGIWPINADGSIGEQPTAWVATNSGAHSIQIDPSNKFCFVPHIARGNGGILRLPEGRREPANAIFQFKFDQDKGTLTPNDPPRVGPKEDWGPRHYCFHPTKPLIYVCNEQGSNISVYHFDQQKGTLTLGETVTTIPDDFKKKNTQADIQIHKSGKFVYAPNRGHGSVPSFRVKDDGNLELTGWAKTEEKPRAFMLDPTGNFLYVAGQTTGTLKCFRINQTDGTLTEVEEIHVGAMPMWILITEIPGR